VIIVSIKARVFEPDNVAKAHLRELARALKKVY
jgi:hypothetical protein